MSGSAAGTRAVRIRAGRGGAVTGRRLRTVPLPFLVPLLATICLVTVVACGPAKTRSASTAPAGPVSFADCTALAEPPASPPGSGRPSSNIGVPAARPLPELSLPCFAGGPDVALNELRGPAVVTLWASSCGPCREELPTFQRLSQRAGGSVRVVGVNVRDSQDGARSLGEDLGLRFPTLVDREERLLRVLGRPVLPQTLFVDGAGRVQHVDVSGALDDDRLADLVERILGVAVRP